MGFYEKYILPCCLDKACSIGPIEKQRAKIVPFATGTKVEKITGVDPDEHIWKRSQTRRKAVQFPVERIGLSGEDIPMSTGSVDTVVVTYSLCTIPNPIKALREMRRILKPGGDILFCEHGRSAEANIVKWQNRIDPLWSKIAGGFGI